MVSEERCSFDNGQGITLAAKLMMPNEHAPVVILCHGFLSQKDNEKNTALAPSLAAHGIGSFRFDFFAHGESQGSFADITLSEGINDVIAAAHYVQHRFPHSRIALYGASYGGAACFFAAPKLRVEGMALVCPALYYYERKKKSIGAKGIKEWKEKGVTTYTGFNGEKHDLKYGFFEDLIKHNPEKTRQAAPILIVHGDKDLVVPHADSERIVKLLPNASLKMYKGADHYFREPKARQRLISELTTFFVELLTVPEKQAHRH